MGKKGEFMKIDLKWLKEERACSEGVAWFTKRYKEAEGALVVETLIKDKELKWANWLVVRLMTKIECVKYAVFAAEQVIGIYEKKYPDDKRPSKAIEAAKRYIKDPSEVNKKAADAAAYAAANAAVYAADAAAANAAAYAAAADAADANAAYAAAAANAAAAYAAAALRVKILEYGLRILRGKE